MVINTRTVRLFGAAAITIWPFILVDPDVKGTMRKGVLLHEDVHLGQQLPWGIVFAAAWASSWAVLSFGAEWWLVLLSVALGALEGFYAGMIAWRAVYLLCLPVGWNPWRHRWETEAFAAMGYHGDDIAQRLREPPYRLWLM